MPRWTKEDLEAYERKRANSKAGASGLPATNTQPTQRQPLERTAPRKDKGRVVTSPRHRIRFTIYAVRPCDWDGHHIKELQDMLVNASIIPDDNWGFLQGEVISEKAHSLEEERTEIELIQL